MFVICVLYKNTNLPQCGLLPDGEKIWVNIDLGDGLLPDGTKPSPEPQLIYQ